MEKAQLIGACVVVIALLIVAIVVTVKRKRNGETFLIYPYLDLENPDGKYRGSPYALSECNGWGFPE